MPTEFGKNSYLADQCVSVIKSLRVERKLTQVELVELLGEKWGTPRLSRIESGKSPLSRHRIHQLAEVFGIRPEQLYLMCVKAQYPNLNGGEVGGLLDELVNRLSPAEGGET